MLRSASFARLPTRRVCPRVEALESRYCPSVVSPAMPGAPPTIQLMTAASGPHQFTLSGHVTDEYAAGLKITFGGAVAAMDGLSTTVDADGNFSFTVEIPDGDGGGVSAQTTDWWGLASNVAICYVPPTV